MGKLRNEEAPEDPVGSPDAFEERAPLSYAATTSDPRWIVVAARLVGVCLLVRAFADLSWAGYTAWRISVGIFGDTMMGFEGWLRFAALPAATTGCIFIIAAGCLLLPRWPVQALRTTIYGSYAWLALSLVFPFSGLISPASGWGNNTYTWETFFSLFVGAISYASMPALLICLVTRPAVRQLVNEL